MVAEAGEPAVEEVQDCREDVEKEGKGGFGKRVRRPGDDQEEKTQIPDDVGNEEENVGGQEKI